MSFPFSRKISPPPNQESKEHFSLVLPSEARQWRNDLFYIGILLEKSSDFVQETQQKAEGFLLSEVMGLLRQGLEKVHQIFYELSEIKYR